jgi:hypothetical protein
MLWKKYIGLCVKPGKLHLSELLKKGAHKCRIMFHGALFCCKARGSRRLFRHGRLGRMWLNYRVLEEHAASIFSVEIIRSRMLLHDVGRSRGRCSLIHGKGRGDSHCRDNCRSFVEMMFPLSVLSVYSVLSTRISRLICVPVSKIHTSYVYLQSLHPSPLTETSTVERWLS